ncbi:stage III sporulation protein AA [Bacillaceae bacterium SIJ1]|uniref:stage III sporulation protein AA n=1 Tax=Litoribacterium kuwaitense TaxID=1398745 RepID=UPI0013EC8E84|nr:stage III sporulation protein AA [Litoribacterium kuwaitense]NGP43596.1 stage III sporulation protein AA [Litoribacterium kuwaitense]
MENVISLLPVKVQTSLHSLSLHWHDIEEIRLRVDKPVEVRMQGRSRLLSGALFMRDDAIDLVQRLTDYSMYAHEHDIRLGYITLRGGHRIGLCGSVVHEDGRVRTLKHITSFNIRLAHEKKGVADRIAPFLCKQGEWQSTLVLGPPKSGKTTLIRDIVRLISEGGQDIPARTVGIVDERSEIAACKDGVPQYSFGPRVDVLDGCPKAAGMMMMVRTMSPDVLIVDEIGEKEDALAVMEAIHAGVKVIASAHAFHLDDIFQRPALKELMNASPFSRMIELDHVRTGAIRTIKNEHGHPFSLKESNEVLR